MRTVFVPVSQRYGTMAYCGAAGAGRVHFFRLSAFARRKYFRIFADKRDTKDQLAFSFLGLLGAQFGFYYTISLCNAATATVLQYTSPVFVMLWMSFKSRRLPEGREFLGIIFALVGVFLISTHGDINNVVLSPEALVIGLISAVSLAFYTVQPMRLLQKFSTTLVVGWGQLLSGTLLCFL